MTPRNLTVETFVRIDSRILMSHEFFWLEIIIYEVLLRFRESLLVLSHLSTPTSSLFTVSWTLSMSLSHAKTVVSSAKWTKRIWSHDLCMSLIFKRSTGPSDAKKTFFFCSVLFFVKKKHFLNFFKFFLNWYVY